MNFTEDFSGQGWHHDVTVYPVGGEPYLTQVGNIFVPDGWSFAFWHGLPVDHDPTNNDGWSQPEGRYVHKADFPNRVHTGDHAWMFFGFWKIVHGVLYRSFQVTPGQALSASAWAHAWSSNHDAGPGNDPPTSEDGQAIRDDEMGIVGNVRFRIGIDPTGNTDIRAASIVWTAPQQIYDEFAQLRINQVIATSGWATLFVRGLCFFRLKHNDFYFGPIELWTEDAPMWYPPRVDYARMYHLIGHDATQEQYAEVAETAFANQSTLGFSADDAGIGPTVRKVAAYWATPDSWSSKPDVQHFFDTYYHGVELTQVDLYEPTPPLPPVDPPLPPTDPPVDLKSQNPIGLHVIWNIAGVVADEGQPSYVRDARPRIMKQTIGGGNCFDFKRMWPDCTCVWRDVQTDDHGYVDAADRRASARALLQKYLDKGLEQWASSIDFIEAENETVAGGSIHYDKHMRIIEFQVYFLEELYKLMGNEVRGVILNIPVGNPEPNEYDYFWPAAKTAVDYNGAIGYHGYWAAREPQWLLETWPYLAGRWVSMDQVWNQRGIYPQHIIGEAAPLYTATGGPYDLSITKSWRSGIGWDRYLQDLETLDVLVAEWNVLHQNRCLGYTLFTVGGEGWDDFYLNTGEIDSLRRWAIERGMHNAPPG